MEYSHYTTFVHKFVISMEEFKKCNLALNVKKDHIFNSQEEKILTQHEAWRDTSKRREDTFVQLL